MSDAAVLVERRGSVLLVTINRPEARNAVNGAVSTGIGDALAQAQDDDEVRAVVITGTGDKSFCAGADLKAIASRENIYHPEHPEWGFAGYVQHFIDKPTIAAVNGTALGGGTEIALASDLVVAEQRAQFGLPEVKRGLIAGAGGVFRIVDQLPRKVALELLYTGDPMSAADAARWGLVNRVVDDGGLWKPRWSWPNRSPATRHCRCGPASGSLTASRTAPSPAKRRTGPVAAGSSVRCCAPRTPKRGRGRLPKSAHRCGRRVERSA